MQSAHDEAYQDLTALTQEAVRAAEAGEWNRVAACYGLRARQLGRTPIDPITAKRLIEMDLTVQERARLSQAATHQLLDEVTGARNELVRLKRCIGSRVDHGARFNSIA